MGEFILLIAFICIIPTGLLIINVTDRFFHRDGNIVGAQGDMTSDELTFSHHWIEE